MSKRRTARTGIVCSAHRRLVVQQALHAYLGPALGRKMQRGPPPFVTLVHPRSLRQQLPDLQTRPHPTRVSHTRAAAAPVRWIRMAVVVADLVVVAGRTRIVQLGPRPDLRLAHRAAAAKPGGACCADPEAAARPTLDRRAVHRFLADATLHRWLRCSQRAQRGPPPPPPDLRE